MCDVDPCQSIPKNESSKSASISKGHNPQIPPRVAPQAVASFGASCNSIQCFGCHGRGQYASECLHRTLAIEHESFEPPKLQEEVVDPEGGFDDLVDFENSHLHDAHLGVVRYLLANPVMNDEWKRTTIFYTVTPSNVHSSLFAFSSLVSPIRSNIPNDQDITAVQKGQGSACT